MAVTAMRAMEPVLFQHKASLAISGHVHGEKAAPEASDSPDCDHNKSAACRRSPTLLLSDGKTKVAFYTFLFWCDPGWSLSYAARTHARTHNRAGSQSVALTLWMIAIQCQAGQIRGRCKA